MRIRQNTSARSARQGERRAPLPTRAKDAVTRAAVASIAVVLVLVGLTFLPSTQPKAVHLGGGNLAQGVSLIPGTRVINPESGRIETASADLSSSAVIIGDSQAAGARGVPSAQTWPLQGLRQAGLTPIFRGKGGIGFVAHWKANGPNFLDGIRGGDYVLPFGRPALVVIEGGGNDARLGASDAEIADNARALVVELRKSYPTSPMVMIGTLSRSYLDGGGRRLEVDQLLGRLAASMGVEFIDVGGWLTQYGLGAYLADKVHLNAEGHALAAPLLAKELRARGLIGQSPVSPAGAAVRYDLPGASERK